jgi:adenylyltransferase/sulfurtransferase
MLPEIGRKGQIRLKEARVLLSGLGGLGSTSAYYLAAAGIGHMRIVDRDKVEVGNLNRQILHNTADIGKPKTESALEKIRLLNPHCQVEAFHLEINQENITDLVENCTVVLDGTDNLKTRKIVNTACFEKGTPFVFGGVEGFNGMVSTFVPGQTPCLDCLFPAPPSQAEPPGVLGPAPGLVASIQVMETIKLILALEGLLKGRLLLVRGLNMSFREIRIDKNPDCRICGTSGGINGE